MEHLGSYTIQEPSKIKMDFLGIKFAPLSIPLERRLQTLSAALFFVSLGLGVFLCSFLFLYLFTTRFWWSNLLYLTWMYYDRLSPKTGGHASSWFLQLKIWEYYRDYFSTDFVCSFEPDPNRNYFFACFPHSIIPGGPHAALQVPKFRELFGKFAVKCGSLNLYHLIPFLREYAMAIGFVSCSRESLSYVLSQPGGGNVLLLWPGGTEEALHTDQYTFVVKKRKGFVKLALETGTPLVPVVTFGEIDTYRQFGGETVKKFQRFVKKFTGFPPVLFNGRGFFQYSFGLVPRRVQLTIVAGPPLEVKQVKNPSNEEVEVLHGRFVEELEKLFEEHRKKYVKSGQKKLVLL